MRCDRDLAAIPAHAYPDFVVRSAGVAYCVGCGWPVGEHPPRLGPPPQPPPPGGQLGPDGVAVAPERSGFRGQLPPRDPDPWADFRLRLDDIEISLPYLPSHRDFVRSCVRHISSFILNPEFMSVSRARFDGEGDLQCPMKRVFRLVPDPPGPPLGGLRSACCDLERLGRHVLGLLWCVAHARMSSPREAIPVAKTPLGLSSEISAIEWIWDRGSISWDYRMSRPPLHVLRSWHYLLWWGLNFALLVPDEWPEAFLSFTVELGEAYYQKNKEFFTDRGTWQIKYSDRAVAAAVRAPSEFLGPSRRRRGRPRDSSVHMVPDSPPPPPPAAIAAAPASLPLGPAALARRASSAAPQPLHAGRGGAGRGGRGKGRGRFGRPNRGGGRSAGAGRGSTPSFGQPAVGSPAVVNPKS